MNVMSCLCRLCVPGGIPSDLPHVGVAQRAGRAARAARAPLASAPAPLALDALATDARRRRPHVRTLY